MTLAAGATAVVLALILAIVGGMLLSSKDVLARVLGVGWILAAIWLLAAAAGLMPE